MSYTLTNNDTIENPNLQGLNGHNPHEQKAAFTVVRTEEERNMQRLYHDTMKEGDIASIADYSPLGDWLDIGTDLHNERLTNGTAGARTYIARLQKSDKRLFKSLTALVSDNPVVQSSEVGTLLSDVKPEVIRWLWKYRLALGKITMLDGDPGLGKSNLTIDIAARVSNGSQMPDYSPGLAAGGVVLITPEDGLADTVQPRLARAGANLRKIVSIGTIPTKEGTYEYNRPFTLPQDLEMLEKAIARVKAKLVIIDPVMAILGTKDTYKDNEVRSILAPVQMLIEQAGAACIMVRHLTKGGGDNALYRGGGSMAFIALARTGLMVAKDPLDSERCILAHTKTNIGRVAESLSYRIISDELTTGDERPYIEWCGASDVAGADILTAPRKNIGNIRQDILRLLQEHKPSDLTIAEINESLSVDHPEITLTNIKTTLKRMYDKQEIGKSERGSYHAL